MDVMADGEWIALWQPPRITRLTPMIQQSSRSADAVTECESGESGHQVEAIFPNIAAEEVCKVRAQTQALQNVATL